MTDLFDPDFFTAEVGLSQLPANERSERYTEQSREWLPALRKLATGLVAFSVFVVAPAFASEPRVVPGVIVSSDRPSQDLPEPDRVYDAPGDADGLARLLLKTTPLKRLDDLL